MKKKSIEKVELRRRAEEALREKTPAPPRTEDETQKLLHELQVHQVELEMQNEDLRHARDELEAALEKYTDLYDFITDITERKRIDEEVQRLHTKLERRAYELEVVNQELEAFSYTVSHDLRSPLTIIGGYCEVIQKVCGDRLDEQCRGYLHQVDQGIQRMNELIDTLLNFSRLTHSELRSEQVDLSEMARAVAVELGKEHPERRVTFSIAPGVSVRGDPKLLRVVLQNLLGNAWKYTGQKEDAVIEFGVTEVVGKRACFVRDNGPGFDSAHADLLFRAFHRLPGQQEFSGFGIGLATVQRIIQLHDGRAWAEGALGKGATFYFTLG